MDTPFPFRFTGVLWSTLTSDPGTALMITDSRGRVVWMDDAASMMLLGAGASSAADGAGVSVGGADSGWLGEWLVLLRRTAEDGRTRVMRCIWRGYQTFFWVNGLEPENAEAGVEAGSSDGEEGVLGVDGVGALDEMRFLVIARRITQDVVDEQRGLGDASGRGLEVIESGYADLGPLSVLSSREVEVLALLGQGMSAKEIAGVLHRSPKTVENHRNAIGNKLGVGDRVLLAAMARRAGLTRADAGKKRIRVAS